MRDAVFHLTPVTPGTTQASARIAKTLAEVLSLPLVDRSPTEDYNGTLYIVNSPSAFCTWNQELADLVEDAKEIVWIMNDYTIYPSTQIRQTGRKMKLWSTVPDLSPYSHRVTYTDCLPMRADYYVNWNALAYEPLEPRVGNGRLIYYGSFRQDKRTEKFKRFFAGLDFDISAAPAQRKLFQEHFPNATYYDSLRPLIPTLQNWTFTLLTQDNFSDRMFTSLPTRFYECLSAGLIMLFDPAMKSTFEGQGMKFPEEFVVENRSDIETWIYNLDSETCCDFQRDLFGIDHAEKIRQRIKEIA